VAQTVNLEEEQYRALAALAEQEGQSVDALVKQAVYQLLARRQPTGPLSA
jgi:hypothetical protein